MKKRKTLILILTISIFFVIGSFFVFGATPLINNVVLNSTNILTNSTNQNITGYISASDGDGDNITYIYNWYKNDSLDRTTLIENGLISYFPFDNDAYDYLYDNNSFLLNGAFINSTFGQKEGSLSLDGSDDIANLSGGAINIGVNHSISFWIYWKEPAESNEYQAIVGYTGSSFMTNIMMKDYSGNVAFFYHNGTTYGAVDSSYASMNNSWYHIVSVRENANVSFYVNGNLVGSNDAKNFQNEMYVDRIGARGSSAFFNGSIDELMIFNRTLSGEEVGQLYLGGLEKNIVSSDYTSVGDVWKLGAKVADNISISKETNSSELNITPLLVFSDTTTSGIFDYFVNVSFQDNDLSGQSYSLVDFNDTIRWWIPFNDTGSDTAVGMYNGYEGDIDYGGSAGSLTTDPYGGSALDYPSSSYYILRDWAYILPDDFWTNQEFTISTWAILNNESNTIVGSTQTMANQVFLIGHGDTSSNDCTGFGIYSIRDSQCYGVDLKNNISYGDWVMITMVYDDGKIEAYVNGSLIGSYEGVPDYENSSSFKGTETAASARMWLGNWNANTNSQVSALGEFIFVQRAMNADEITFLYNSTDTSLDLEYYDSDLNPDENITMKGYLVNSETLYETGERNLQINNTYYLNLTSFLKNNLVVQRNITTNNSVIQFEGNYPSDYDGNILYKINNVGYSDLNLDSGTFSKNLTLSSGSYDFEVYFEDFPKVSDSVSNIGVGDIIVILGQSNARLNYADLSSYYSKQSPYDFSLSFVNGYNGTNWTYSSSFTETSSYSNQWFPLIDQISYTQNVPVMVVSAVIGGSTVSCWANLSQTASNEKQCYIGLLDQLVNLTYNNEVYGVIYYQGEQDISNEDYKTTWRVFLDNLFSDVVIESEKIVLGNTWAFENIPFYPQKATQELWAENYSDGVRIGSYVYDMNTTDLGGIVHFSEISNEGWPFINRWKTAGLYNFYDYGDMRIPNLTEVYIVNSTRVDMVYDRALVITDFLDNSGSIAWGLQLYNDTEDNFTRTSNWNMSNVASTSLNSNVVTYNFNTSVSNAVQYSYCINTYCNNKSVVRDSTSVYPSSFPSLMVYPTNLSSNETYVCLAQGKYWYSNGCHDSPQTTNEESGSSGSASGTFRPSENALQNGWRVNVAKGQKVQVPVGDSNKNIEIKSVNEDKVVVSVDGNEYEISNSASGKIDLDDDGFYDVKISNNGATGSYARLEFKLIHEEVPSGQEEGQEENILDKIPEVVKKIKWYWYVGVIVVLIGVWLLVRFGKKKL